MVETGPNLLKNAYYFQTPSPKSQRFHTVSSNSHAWDYAAHLITSQAKLRINPLLSNGFYCSQNVSASSTNPEALFSFYRNPSPPILCPNPVQSNPSIYVHMKYVKGFLESKTCLLLSISSTKSKKHARISSALDSPILFLTRTYLVWIFLLLLLLLLLLSLLYGSSTLGWECG